MITGLALGAASSSSIIFSSDAGETGFVTTVPLASAGGIIVSITLSVIDLSPSPATIGLGSGSLVVGGSKISA